MFDHPTYLAVIERETAAFARLLDESDPATPIPTCPGWDLVALAKHTGIVHRWATQMICNDATERLDFRKVDRNLPDTAAGYGQWLRAGGAALVAALSSRPPEATVWTWGPGGTTGWWARRLAYETLVHHADAELAIGRTPIIQPGEAVDAIDEFFANLPAAGSSFAPAVAELRGDGETVHFHATDAHGEWIITLTPAGFTVEHGHAKGDVAARATAADLLLLLYGRISASDAPIARFGDTALLDRWLSGSAI